MKNFETGKILAAVGSILLFLIWPAKFLWTCVNLML